MKRFIVVVDTDIYDQDDAEGCTLADAVCWVEAQLLDTPNNPAPFTVDVTAYRVGEDLAADFILRQGPFARDVEPLPPDPLMATPPSAGAPV